jgi:Lrp/AsnC family leucine-responsive transcriptional regulator
MKQISKLDSLDRQLLAIIQRDASLTSEQLADRVGLSASAIQRRLNRFRRNGVIRAHVGVVDPAKLGAAATFIVGLEVERERADLLGRLKSWLLGDDAVQEVFYVTGEWDLIAIIITPSVEAFDKFMSGLMIENPNVRRFTTHVVLAIHKRELFVPTDLGSG